MGLAFGIDPYSKNRLSDSPLVLFRKDSERGISQESHRHYRIEQSGAETEKTGAILVGLHAQAMVELQTETDTGPVVAVLLTNQKTGPVIAGNRKLSDQPLAPGPGQRQTIEPGAASCLLRLFVESILLNQDSGQGGHRRSLVSAKGDCRAENHIVVVSQELCSHLLGSGEDRTGLHVRAQKIQLSVLHAHGYFTVSDALSQATGDVARGEDEVEFLNCFHRGD